MSSGSSASAKPALVTPEPLSMTMGLLLDESISSSFDFFFLFYYFNI